MGNKITEKPVTIDIIPANFLSKKLAGKDVLFVVYVTEMDGSPGLASLTAQDLTIDGLRALSEVLDEAQRKLQALLLKPGRA